MLKVLIEMSEGYGVKRRGRERVRKYFLRFVMANNKKCRGPADYDKFFMDYLTIKEMTST